MDALYIPMVLIVGLLVFVVINLVRIANALEERNRMLRGSSQ